MFSDSLLHRDKIRVHGVCTVAELESARQHQENQAGHHGARWSGRAINWLFGRIMGVVHRPLGGYASAPGGLCVRPWGVVRPPLGGVCVRLWRGCASASEGAVRPPLRGLCVRP